MEHSTEMWHFCKCHVLYWWEVTSGICGSIHNLLLFLSLVRSRPFYVLLNFKTFLFLFHFVFINPKTSDRHTNLFCDVSRLTHIFVVSKVFNAQIKTRASFIFQVCFHCCLFLSIKKLQPGIKNVFSNLSRLLDIVDVFTRFINAQIENRPEKRWKKPLTKLQTNTDAGWIISLLRTPLLYYIFTKQTVVCCYTSFLNMVNVYNF